MRGSWRERHPADRPELNPGEYPWAHLKEYQILNPPVEQDGELYLHATRALHRIIRPVGIRQNFASNVSLLCEPQ